MKVAANSWKYINANLRVFIGRLGLTESISHPLTDKTITIMTNNDSQSAPSSKPARADLLKTITALCNELDELMLLHEFYYQAAECIFGDEGCYDFAHRIQIKHSAQCFIVMNGAMLVKSTKQHKQQHDPRIIALVKLLARGAAAADIQAECQNNPHGEKPCNESPSTPDIPRTSSETVA